MCLLPAAAWNSVRSVWSEVEFLIFAGMVLFLGMQRLHFLSGASGNFCTFLMYFILFLLFFFFFFLSIHYTYTRVVENESGYSEFKYWGVLAFLMALGKGWIPKFSFQLGVNSRTDCVLLPLYGYRSRWQKNIEFKQAVFRLKFDLVFHPAHGEGVG